MPRQTSSAASEGSSRPWTPTAYSSECPLPFHVHGCGHTEEEAMTGKLRRSSTTWDAFRPRGANPVSGKHRL